MRRICSIPEWSKQIGNKSKEEETMLPSCLLLLSSLKLLGKIVKNLQIIHQYAVHRLQDLLLTPLLT